MVHSPFSSSFQLGILGGGQLGKMLCQVAYQMDISTAILDPDLQCSAAQIAKRFVHGSFKDFDTVLEFGRTVDVITIEIEHVNLDALEQLEKEGKTIHPNPKALRLIQNKQSQKDWYAQLNLPTSPFSNHSSKLGFSPKFPFVWKSATGGYDGKGVSVVHNENDWNQLPDIPFVAEGMVDIQTEIAVIAVRNAYQTTCLPACSMVFHPTANLVTQVVSPAQIDSSILQQAETIATQLINDLAIQGLLAVEFFVDTQGQLLINEVAPRPHNSGHFTIEGAESSQYDQHLRGILNLPLGSSRLKSPSVMVNIIGEPGFMGPVFYQGMDEVLGIPGASVHLYGKKETRPFRKMGHVTITDVYLDSAMDKGQRINQILKAISL
jgi:5-(carboxyamino)imidazole ribonucleotide synthase